MREGAAATFAGDGMERLFRTFLVSHFILFPHCPLDRRQ